MDNKMMKHEQLSRRLDQNFNDFKRAMLKKSRQDIFDKVYEIAACQMVYRHMKLNRFDEQDLDYLLKFKNPLELVTDHYKQNIRVDSDAFTYLIYHICDTKDLLNDYPLMPDNKQHETER